MRNWTKQDLANKKAEQMWGFACVPGGGGILNVASIEELDAIMSEFPFRQFSDTEICALTDLEQALVNSSKARQKMIRRKP
jgi:muconolactone delta-isomerase